MAPVGVVSYITEKQLGSVRSYITESPFVYVRYSAKFILPYTVQICVVCYTTESPFRVVRYTEEFHCIRQNKLCLILCNFRVYVTPQSCHSAIHKRCVRYNANHHLSAFDTLKQMCACITVVYSEETL